MDRPSFVPAPPSARFASSAALLREVLESADDGGLAGTSRALGRVRALGLDDGPLSRVYVLRNFTLEPLAPFLELAAIKRGLRVEARFAPFDAIEHELASESSLLRSEPHDLVVLALWLDALPWAFTDAGVLRADAVAEHVEGLVARLREAGPSPIGVTTFLPPLVRTSHWPGYAALAALNERVRRLASSRVTVIDLARMAEQIGLENAYEPRYWFLYRAPLSPALGRRLSESLARDLAAAKGRHKKVLVLDCDGTLWGGVVGEDGPAGIALDAHDHPGNVFHAFQRQVVALSHRGVLIALCSKNDEASVFEVLDDHPGAALRRAHVSAHRVNWAPKVDNLIALSRELNVGLDSFVFVDDSPVECAFVRAALPMVDVLEVPKNTADLPGLLQRYDGFPAGPITPEDKARARAYAEEEVRRGDRASFSDFDSFVSSLALRAEVGSARASDVARVAQLTQRTNQFNLTTRRYRESDVEALLASPDALVFVMRAADRYGDYGLVGVGIVKREGESLRVDSLLMSCRALGRGLEQALLAEVLAEARRRFGELPLTAEYLPTAKNGLVERFYADAGFQATREGDDGTRYQATERALAARAPHYVAVTRRGEET
jgi:FkbH-like protein